MPARGHLCRCGDVCVGTRVSTPEGVRRREVHLTEPAHLPIYGGVGVFVTHRELALSQPATT